MTNEISSRDTVPASGQDSLDAMAFPLMWRNEVQACVDAIKSHNKFIVTAHARLDGDALSSIASAGHLLKALHKEFVLYTPFGIPSYLSFLPLPSRPVELLHNLPFKPECVLALDCGTPHRLGKDLLPILEKTQCINIDHHPGIGMGTACTLIKPEACATAQLLASVIFASGAGFSQEMAQALSLGIITDTGGFRHDNLTPYVFALASRLTLAGANIYQIREQLDKNETLCRFRLWSRLLAKVRVTMNGAVAICTCSMADLKETGTTVDDTEGLVEKMRELKGVNVAALVREQEPDTCRISLRSSADTDVSRIAAVLGGGGHRKAAGCTIRMPLKDAADVLLGHIAQLGIAGTAV